jgi:hypothetical protein
MKRLQVIKKTQKGHRCCNCGKNIKKGSEAMALVYEEVIDGYSCKTIAYFCNVNCYNALELRELGSRTPDEIAALEG